MRNQIKIISYTFNKYNKTEYEEEPKIAARSAAELHTRPRRQQLKYNKTLIY
jgi:hypothetical protein